jgi:hypothetical protein
MEVGQGQNWGCRAKGREKRLRVFEKRALRRIFGSKRDEMILYSHYEPKESFAKRIH